MLAFAQLHRIPKTVRGRVASLKRRETRRNPKYVKAAINCRTLKARGRAGIQSDTGTCRNPKYTKAARDSPHSRMCETYLPKFGGFFRHHVNTEKNEMKTTHAYFGWLFGTAHTAYHWGALLECGTRVPLWFPERKFGIRKNEMERKSSIYV